MKTRRNESAQSLVEYSVILALIAMVAVAMLRGIGTSTSKSMTPVDKALK